MRRAVIVGLVAAAVVATAGVWRASAGPQRPLDREACAADESWGRQRVNALLAGERVLPYEPFSGTQVVRALRRAGFVLPLENGLFALYESGLQFPDICDFRWFSETPLSVNPAGADQGYLKVFVVATPTLAAFEHGERIRLAKKYKYAHAMTSLRRGNVVVDYYFKNPDGQAVRRNRLADVRRILNAL